KTYTVTSSSVSAGSATVNYSNLNGNSPVNIYGSVGNSLGAVTYNVESTALNTTVTIYGNNNNDTVNASPTAMNLDNFRGNLSFVSGGGTNTINVNDQKNPRPDTFALSGSSVSRTNSATIDYGFFNVNRTINAGTGNNTVNVSGLAPSGNLAFNGGGG